MKRIDPQKITGLKRFLQAAAVLFVAVVIMKLDWKLRGPEAMRHLAKIEGELHELRPLPDALLMSAYPSVNPDVGVLDATYVVQGESPTDIERWYKEEFGRLNWKPLSVESRQSKRQLRYCRNGETAALILPEDSVGPKTEFKINIGWGGAFGC